MTPQPFTLEFPLGGVSKRFGFEKQKPQTTPSALNVWPVQWSTGRARGGVRPGLTSTGGAPSGTPLNSITASWIGGFGVALTTSNGSYLTTDGSTWTQRITAPTSSSFASCAIFNDFIYQADYGAEVDRRGTTSGSQHTLDSVVTAGTAPTDCGIVIAHAGRLIFGGFASDPHLIQACRIGEPLDYNYTQTDAGAAFSSAGITGTIRNPVTSLVNHGNGCLLIGAPDSMDVLRGDLLSGGQIEEFAHEVGPLMQSAWCKTDSGSTIFMSRLGLYGIAPGCVGAGTGVLCLTDEIPNDLVAIDPAAGDTCSVCFDGRYQGVHVYVDRNSGTDAAYFFHLASKSWWPMSFAVGTIKLGVNLKRAATATKSGLIALRSGGAYWFDTESTENIDSHVWYGPLLAPDGMDMKLQHIAVTRAANSTNSTFDAYVAKGAEEAYNSPSAYNWTDSEDTKLNYRKLIMRRFGAAYVKHSGTGTQRPCLEKLGGSMVVVSGQRKDTDDA